MAMLSLVLGISILLQFTAAFLALRLTRITGRRTAWALIAAAVSLMALRRCITLFGLISGGLPRPPDLLAELVALGTSALMVVGIVWIAPLFLSIKRAEEALRESGEKYRLLVENSNEVIIVAQDGMLKFINPKAMEITGYSQEELASKPFAELIHPDDQEMAVKYYLECLQGEETPSIYGLRIIDKDGNTKWLESNATLITWEGSPATLNFLTDITERKRVEEALQRRNRELALLNQAGRAFVSTLDVDQVLVTTLEETRCLLDAVAGSVWLIDPATDELVCRQATGPHSEIVRGWRLAPGQGIAGCVARSGESLIVPDVQADERHFKGVDQQTGLSLRSILSVPLMAKRDVIGVLQVMDTEANRFSPTDLELLEPLAAAAASAIHNARLYEQIQHRMESLTNLNRASQVIASSLDVEEVLEQIVELAGSVVNSNYTSVALLDEEEKPVRGTEYFIGMPPISQRIRGRGVTSLVLGSGQAVIVDVISGEGEMNPPVRWFDGELIKANPVAVTAGIRSFAAIPIQAKGRTMGVLFVHSLQPGTFHGQLSLLTTFANQAAVAIENARLYEQARRDAETKSTLLREVNHRVKNNLSAIIGLLYAERRYARLEEQTVYQSITQDLANRVQGLATVHSLLSASEWAPLRLSELTAQVIRSSLKTLPHGKRVSVDVTPSPVQVTPDQAHDMTLVINELATNTVKHTLRERTTAHIAVRIGLDDDTVLFEFRDDGPGYPEEVLQLERYSMGFDLIQNIVRKGLRGELSLHNDRGAVAVIRWAIMIQGK